LLSTEAKVHIQDGIIGISISRLKNNNSQKIIIINQPFSDFQKIFRDPSSTKVKRL